MNREVALGSRFLSHSSSVPNKPYGFCGHKVLWKKDRINMKPIIHFRARSNDYMMYEDYTISRSTVTSRSVPSQSNWWNHDRKWVTAIKWSADWLFWLHEWLTNWLVSLSYWLANWLADWLHEWLTGSLVELLILLIDWFDWLVGWGLV